MAGEGVKSVQRELRRRVKDEKNPYKERTENNVQLKDLTETWGGRTITDYKQPTKGTREEQEEHQCAA